MCRPLHTCCCGCSLKQGCIIIGAVYIFLDLLHIGNTVYNSYHVYEWLVITAIVLAVIFLAMPIILIWGAMQAKPSIVTVAFILLILQAVFGVIQILIYTIIIGGWNLIGGIIYFIFGIGMFAAWFIYPALVIWSHYKELEAGGMVHTMS